MSDKLWLIYYLRHRWRMRVVDDGPVTVHREHMPVSRPLAVQSPPCRGEVHAHWI